MTQERRMAPLFTAADNARLLAIVNSKLDVPKVGKLWPVDDEGIRYVDLEQEVEALECACRGGNFKPLAELAEDRGLLIVAEWIRGGMKVDRRQRASGDRSKVYRAARELPAIQQVLREHCGDGTRERAIPFAARRHGIAEDTLRNHLKSRRRPRPSLSAR
jgi:hypothetical protein